MEHASPSTAHDPRRTLTMNGVASSGWIDLDRAPSRGLVGLVCLPYGARSSPVAGQVVAVDGPMQIEGTERRMRGEFLVTKCRDCTHGRCVYLSVFPMVFEERRERRAM